MKGKISGSKMLTKLFEENIGREIPLEEINALCSEYGLHQWDRVVRNLRQQKGYDITNCPGKWYKLNSLEKLPVKAKRGYISKKLRYLVFERDNFTCQACGRKVADGIMLSPDHIVPVEWGGETSFDNLQALCIECNEGKKAWVSGEDADIMKKVQAASSAKERLRLYFEFHPNEEIPVYKLSAVGRTREWTRQLRLLREDYDMKIVFIAKNKKENRKESYVFIKEE